MAGQFTDLQAVVAEHALDVIAVRLALRGQFDIEESAVPGRNLQRLETLRLGPLSDVLQVVERRLGGTELCQVQTGSFKRTHHVFLLFVD